ncbi:MAG: glycosyltransferase family 4 protein, partial [Deltaproteobacteria bacterium]
VEITKSTRLNEEGSITGQNSRRSEGYLLRRLSMIKEQSGAIRLFLRGRKIDGFTRVKDFFLSSDIRHEVARASKDLKVLERTVREFEPDIIFLQTLLYPCYLAFFLPETIPLVITFWNGDLTWWAQWSGIERRFKKALVTYGLGRAQAITVNSASALNACVEYGAAEDKIRLIRYPGVDLDRFRPSVKDEARTKLEIDFEKVVLSPRGLGGYLNSDIIVEAIPMVIQKHPDTLFLFLSGNDEEQEWEKHLQKAKQFGAEKNVRCDGKVPWDLMGLYYNASDTMVSISSNDSLPNCMLEAMACGTPIVMGDIPSIREWVTDEVNGFLVPLRDPVALSEKIIRALDGPEDMTMSFVQKNLELARRTFDTAQKSQEIKKLVHEIAG